MIIAHNSVSCTRHRQMVASVSYNVQCVLRSTDRSNKYEYKLNSVWTAWYSVNSVSAVCVAGLIIHFLGSHDAL